MEFNRAFSHWVVAGSLVFGLTAAAAARAAAAHREVLSVLLLAAGSLLFLNAAIVGYQSYSPLSSSAPLAKKLKPMLGPRTPVFAVKYYEQPLPFYLKRPVTLVQYVSEFELGERQEPGKWVHDLEDFARRWSGLSEGFAVTDPATFASLQKRGLPMQVIDRTPRRVLVKRP